MILDWLTKDNITPARIIVQMMFNTMPEALWEHGIQYYNTERLQRNLGVLTPMEKHDMYYAA